MNMDIEMLPSLTLAKHLRPLMARAYEWATGYWSHINEFVSVEPGVDHRANTLAECARADAAEVVKWTAIAVAEAELSAAMASINKIS
jgi:hypothetical protein